MTTKEEIISYVMNTPANTNEAVLRSLLDELDGGSGGSLSFEILSKVTNKTLIEIDASSYYAVDDSIVTQFLPLNTVLKLTIHKDNNEDSVFYSLAGPALEGSQSLGGSLNTSAYDDIDCDFSIGEQYFGVVISDQTGGTVSWKIEKLVDNS